MRDLLNSRRWPLSLAAALLLLLALAEGAARFYPTGVLEPRLPSRGEPLVLLPVPEIEVPTREAPEPPQRRERPEPPPTLVRDLWRSLVADRAAALTVVPDAAAAPPLDLSIRAEVFLAERDTGAAHLYEAARLLREGIFADYRNWGDMLNHLQRAQSYTARKSSIFNEDWLSEDALR